MPCTSDPLLMAWMYTPDRWSEVEDIRAIKSDTIKKFLGRVLSRQSWVKLAITAVSQAQRSKQLGKLIYRSIPTSSTS